MSLASYEVECNSCRLVKKLKDCRQVNLKVFDGMDYVETIHMLCLTCIRDFYGALDHPVPESLFKEE
jgi:hypothetical protein